MLVASTCSNVRSLPPQLLWDKGQPYRAVSEAQVLDRQAQEHTLPAPFADEKDHNRFAAEVGWVGRCTSCVLAGLDGQG